MRKDTNVRSGSLKFSDDVSGVLKIEMTVATEKKVKSLVSKITSRLEVRFYITSLKIIYYGCFKDADCCNRNRYVCRW